jgi:hypothetical protein
MMGCVIGHNILLMGVKNEYKPLQRRKKALTFGSNDGSALKIFRDS